MTRSDLEYIRLLNDLISGGIMHIAELKSKAYPGAITYDDTGGSHPMPTNMIEEVFCQIDEEEIRLNKLIDKRYNLRQQAFHEIRTLCPDYAERHIMYLRYLTIEPLSWSDIFGYVHKYHNISERQMYKLHHDVVNRLERHNI